MHVPPVPEAKLAPRPRGVLTPLALQLAAGQTCQFVAAVWGGLVVRPGYRAARPIQTRKRYPPTRPTPVEYSLHAPYRMCLRKRTRRRWPGCSGPSGLLARCRSAGPDSMAG